MLFLAGASNAGQDPLSHMVTRRRVVVLSVVGVAGLAFFGASLGVLYHFKHPHNADATAQLGQTPRHEWRVIDKRHWQALAEGTEDEATTDAREGTRGQCAPGMVQVQGKHLLDAQGRDSSGEIEELQNKACSNWISKDFPARCQTFDRAMWLQLSAPLPRRSMNYCVDRFEYPNKKGANPVIVVTYTEAAGLCKQAGKRLCSEVEWTFACEGEEALPYPYGYDRSAESCVADRPWRQFSEGAMSPRDGQQARVELDRLWQGSPSGAHAACRSQFGVYDLTGNVDEWTRSVRSSGYVSVLKGGYWGPVRARCRPSTRAHNEHFVAYQQGFRCCADAPSTPVPPAPKADAGAPPAAPVADAGVPPQVAKADAVGPKKAPAVPSGKITPPEVPVADEADDEERVAFHELEELKNRVGLTCALQHGGTGSDLLSPAIVVAAVLLSRRRRRAPSQGD